MMADLDTIEELSMDTLPGETTAEEDQFDPARLDRLTKKKLGRYSHLIDWIPETDKQYHFFPFGIVACVLLIVGLGTFLWLRPRLLPLQIPQARPIEATLRWHIGTTPDSIALGKMKQGIPYKAGAIQIARIENEFFVRMGQDRNDDQRDTLVYRCHVEGEENIQVFFEDTTRTQLSPRSTMTFRIYPPGTKPKEKQLDCDGEALIDVTPNIEIPTVINSLRTKITVLGTFFKLRDYRSEDSSAVFCYNGSVRVNDPGRSTAILDSAQRATLRPGHDINVSKNDFPEAKWSSKELVFDFSNEDLNHAMHEIAQWYGMANVVFEDSVDRTTRGEVFTGPISRYLTLQQLLSIIERYNLHFSIQGKTILVKGKP